MQGNRASVWQVHGVLCAQVPCRSVTLYMAAATFYPRCHFGVFCEYDGGECDTVYRVQSSSDNMALNK